MPKYIKVPFEKIFPIWKIIYVENSSERERLNKMDIIVTKRIKKLRDSKDEGNHFIFLSPEEMKYLKDLYESPL